MGVDFNRNSRMLVCVVHWEDEDEPTAGNLKIEDFVPLPGMVNAFLKTCEYYSSSRQKTPEQIPNWVLNTVYEHSAIPVSFFHCLLFKCLCENFPQDWWEHVNRLIKMCMFSTAGIWSWWWNQHFGALLCQKHAQGSWTLLPHWGDCGRQQQ